MRALRGTVKAIAIAALLGAAGVTLLRVQQPEAGTWVRLVSFTPWALPACLLAAALMLVDALRRERAAIGVLVLALVGAGLHAWWLSPFYLGSVPTPAAGSNRTTVMTVNLLHGAADPYQVVREASGRRVDVLALIELRPEALQVMDRAGFADLFRYRAGTVQPDRSSTLNATHDHQVMLSLRDIGLRAVSESTNSGWSPTWPMNGMGRLPLPLVQIDHALVARKLAAIDGDVVKIDGTDHAAVVAQLGLT